jgi:predicted lactoylglutathione lyase
MTNPAHPGRTLFVNMPVADIERSKAFFAKLGFSFDPMFTDENAACMLVGEHAFVMLLSRDKFAEVAKLPIADPTTHTLALYCFSVSSREEVDTVSASALAAGGSEADGAEDYGFMYSRSFFDLDGHGWQVMWMDPAAAGLHARRRRPGLSRRTSRVAAMRRSRHRDRDTDENSDAFPSLPTMYRVREESL